MTHSAPRSLLLDLIHGALGFALVSLAAFSVWAFASGFFKDFGGEIGMYSAIAAVFLILSGVILAPLAGGAGRFYKAFLPAFLLYAIVWCVAWFALRNRTGEWIGAAAGCLVFAGTSLKILGHTKGWLIGALGLFALHTAGYFAGDWAMHDVWLAKDNLAELTKADRAQAALLGKLSWGLFYGLGFGAGIGLVFHRGRVGA